MLLCGCTPIFPFIGKNNLDADSAINKTETNSPSTYNFNDSVSTAHWTPDEVIRREKTRLEGLAKIEKAKAAAALAKLEAEKLNSKKWRKYFYWGVGILGAFCLIIPGGYHILLSGSKKAFYQVKRGVDSFLKDLSPEQRKQAVLKLEAKQDEKTKKLIRKT